MHVSKLVLKLMIFSSFAISATSAVADSKDHTGTSCNALTSKGITASTNPDKSSVGSAPSKQDPSKKHKGKR